MPKELQVAVLAVHSSPSGLVALAFSILVIIVNESGTFAACQHQHTLSKVKTQNKLLSFTIDAAESCAVQTQCRGTLKC